MTDEQQKLENREKSRKHHAKYKDDETYIAKKRANAKAYYYANHDQRLEKNRKYQQEHRLEARERSRLWRKEHREMGRKTKMSLPDVPQNTGQGSESKRKSEAFTQSIAPAKAESKRKV